MNMEKPTQSEQPVPEGGIYEMEVGRLKERLTEMIKMLPGTMIDMGRIWVLAAKTLGIPKAQYEAEFKEITDRMIGRAHGAKERADQTFENKKAA